MNLLFISIGYPTSWTPRSSRQGIWVLLLQQCSLSSEICRPDLWHQKVNFSFLLVTSLIEFQYFLDVYNIFQSADSGLGCPSWGRNTGRV